MEWQRRYLRFCPHKISDILRSNRVLKHRAAFTLIELIFAIVVISITVISLPMMNQVLSTGMEKNLVQEAIFAAATELHEVTTGHWDENSLEPNQPYSLARMIDISGNCETDTSLSTYRLMPGHIAQPLHRRCLESSATNAANSNTDVNVSALEDFSGSHNTFTTNTVSQSGYKVSYTADINVTGNANFNGANPNIKMIKISIKDGTKVVTSLVTYSANIGEIDYFKKAY